MSSVVVRAAIRLIYRLLVRLCRGRWDAKSAYDELVGEMVIGCGIYKLRSVDSQTVRAGGALPRGAFGANGLQR